MIKEVTQTNKNDIIEILKDIAGPLGPTRSIEDMEDLIKLRTDRYSTIDILVDIILNPPDQKELGKIPFEDFEFELVEILTIIDVKDVIKFLKKAKELLYIEQARPLIIDVLGGIHHEESLLILELLLEENLSENEAIRLADTISENGGIKAKEILQKMKVKYSDKSPDVLQEIDICLENIK
jgi:HEAT repeat protein